MPYEIPQQLLYEEKIIFGLTFRQLIYAIIFLLPSLLIFLKTKLNIYLKISIGTFLIMLGLMFMFFNFSAYIKNILAWLKFKEMKISQKKMMEFIPIEKIEKGVVYVRKRN